MFWCLFQAVLPAYLKESHKRKEASLSHHRDRVRYMYTVEPLIKDTLNKGHLCIKDTF